MCARHWHAALLVLAVFVGLAGCSGNYTFDDNEYRPLGDSQALKRGQ